MASPSIRELERQLGVGRRDWAWTHRAALLLQDYGLDVTYHTTVTSNALGHESEKFREAVERGIVSSRILTLTEVKTLFDAGYRIAPVIDSNVLRRCRGYSGHMVVIYAIDARRVAFNGVFRALEQMPLATFRAAWHSPGSDRDVLVVG